MFAAHIDPTYESWRALARGLLASGVPPERVLWQERGDGQLALVPSAGELPRPRGSPVLIPRRFVQLSRCAARHTARERWDLLYRLLWRLTRERRDLLECDADSDVLRLARLVRQVRADAERMKAFVRFRTVGPRGSEYFVAWHRPDHDVAALVAPHFAKRYPNLRWSIFTPFASIHGEGGRLTHGPGIPAASLPVEDSAAAAEELWRTYYAAAFNPARANPRKLARDLPDRFRGALPEAPLIPSLLAAAPARTRQLRSTTGGATSRVLVPASDDLAVIRGAARDCRACPLHEHATAAVFGEGPGRARLMLVGEAPGDVEDRCGRPFVGPAGEVLDRALQAAGILRGDVYVTNAVKHFAWEPRGKRRIHRTPRLSEVHACRPWLEAELASVRPDVLVLLGRTAALSLLGAAARVGELRGRVLPGGAWARSIVVTLHPSAVLRSGDAEAQARAFAILAGDLAIARRALDGPAELGERRAAG